MNARRGVIASGWVLVMLAMLFSPGRVMGRHGVPHSMPPPDVPDGFTAGMAAAMERMDAGMDIASARDPDHDFAAMMIPHHQGAIDMALLELRYGKNTTLKRLAQEIIITQQQEIDVMRATLGATQPVQVEERR